MNISVDAGALCTRSIFGNFVFSANLIKAIAQYDRTNSYTLYTFEDLPLDLPPSMHTSYLRPKTGWMKFSVSLQELLHKKDIYLALNQALPSFTRSRIISFSHGLSFIYHSDLYTDSYAKMRRQVERMIDHCERIIVSSVKVEDEFLSMFPALKGRVVTMPYGVPYDFLEYEEKKREKYFMFCGMGHPIKRVSALLKVFDQYTRHGEFADYKLYLVGPFTHVASDKIIVFDKIGRGKLRELYRRATGYISMSLYESFNLPVLEALSQECPVIGTPGAIIPEMEDLVSIVQDEEALLAQMVRTARGEANYESANVIRSRFKWQNYVEHLVSLYHEVKV